MNRHERRKARAQGLRSERYTATAEAVLAAVQRWRLVHPEATPRLTLQPEDVLLGAPLADVVDRFAKNADARLLMNEVCRSVDGATALMFDVALQMAGVPFERVSLDELGISIPTA